MRCTSILYTNVSNLLTIVSKHKMIYAIVMYVTIQSMHKTCARVCPIETNWNRYYLCFAMQQQLFIRSLGQTHTSDFGGSVKWQNVRPHRTIWFCAFPCHCVAHGSFVIVSRFALHQLYLNLRFWITERSAEISGPIYIFKRVRSYDPKLASYNLASGSINNNDM